MSKSGRLLGRGGRKNTVIFPDTNVILRYLLADNEEQYENISPFFKELKSGRKKAIILSEVILETFYVLTKTYNVPPQEAGSVMKDLILYKGVVNKDKSILLESFDLFFKTLGLSLLDCILCLKAKRQNGKLLTFDKKLIQECSKFSHKE